MVMGLSLKSQHLRRYKDVARLLIKYGRSDIVKQAGWEGTLDDSDHAAGVNGERKGEHRGAVAAKAEELATDLEQLGPTFIKLGQLLSTRADLLPQPYLDALSRLQDHVEPFDFAEVERILAEELKAKPSQIFTQIDERPMAAASLGQVHRATLRDGREVAIKVQRPDIREGIVHDLEALDEIARLLDAHTQVGRTYEFSRILAEFRKSLLMELDYRQEARNLEILRDNLCKFERIVIPAPYNDFTTSRVLTMELVRGRKITDLSPVVLIELDRVALADELAQAYLKQILIDGFFHADPHPGNLLLGEDGRIVLLDLGMVARLSPKIQESLVRLLLAISEGRGDDAADIALQMGERREHADDETFIRRGAELVARNHDAHLKSLSAGRIVQELYGIAAETGIRMPSEFTMIGKALLNLDMVSQTLDPDFNPTASIRKHATDLLRQRVQEKFTKGNRLTALLEASDFTQRLPERLNRILDHLANNKLAVDVDAIDEEQFICGLQKIANRITMGLILAALIVGAALLMRVETPFTLLGYPGLAIILFAAAAIGGLALMIAILRSDR